VRARKSPEEQEGLRESAAITDACFERLVELVRPGVSERELGAAMYERCYALGGEDPLFLSMYPESPGDGTVAGKFGPPGDRVLQRGDVHIFSFELIGPHSRRLAAWSLPLEQTESLPSAEQVYLMRSNPSPVGASGESESASDRTLREHESARPHSVDRNAQSRGAAGRFRAPL